MQRGKAAEDRRDAILVLGTTTASLISGVGGPTAVNLLTSTYQVRSFTWPWLSAAGVVVAVACWSIFAVLLRAWGSDREPLTAICLTDGDGPQVEVFAVTAASRLLWATYWPQRGEWSRWTFLPLSQVVDVAAVTPNAGVVELYALD